MIPDELGPFQRRPTGLLLRLAHQYARSAANEALRALDLDLRHVGVLAVLAERGPQTQKQLTDAIELDKSSMVYVVDKLERQGLVRRERTDNDRRAYAVTLTDLGRHQMTAASQVAIGVLGEILDVLDPAEERQLNDLLRRVIEQARLRRQAPPAAE